jgi:hypothetical protein
MRSSKTFLYILGLKPEKMGGMEIFCRAFARRLLDLGWRVVFCCEAEPSQLVRDALNFPNVVWEVVPVQAGFSLRRAAECASLVRKYKPDVLIYAFNGVLRPYPWVARLLGVRRIFYNDHTSRNMPTGGRNPLKVAAGRLVTLPLTGSFAWVNIRVAANWRRGSSHRIAWRPSTTVSIFAACPRRPARESSFANGTELRRTRKSSCR